MPHAGMFVAQEDLDAAFADLDSLLAEREPQPRGNACRNCGGTDFLPCANPGQTVVFDNVCRACGVVAPHHESCALAVRRNPSNYKRIHHWHERISQLFLHETQIPADDFSKIAEALLDGSYNVINKDVIRAVLRSLDMQIYIERWLQIIQRITGIEPPKPGAQLLESLDSAFIDLQRPFSANKAEDRKNFLNYNYVFCRLFQKFKCSQFGMFFPLIKSKPKLRQLEDTWKGMAESLGWEFTPLKQVAPFCVKIDQPALVLQQIRLRGAALAQVERPIVPWKTGFRKSDHFLLRELDRHSKPAPRHSSPPVQGLQRLGSLTKRRRSGAGAKIRWLPQSKCQRRFE